MTTSRVVAFFSFFILAFAVLGANLALLCTNETYAQAAANQSETILTLYNGRGNIYDCMTATFFRSPMFSQKPMQQWNRAAAVITVCSQ